MTQDTPQILIYTKKTKGHFNITSDLTIKNVKIYDALGLLVYNENYNNKSINISNLSLGGYVVTSETRENIELSNVLIIS
tara:strand:- start:1507 stop:1746 length:240 start_codon:yes stop_codon:yes gene_type:complete